MTNAVWQALDATWPAAETRRVGPWTVRRGLGGGKRVSATSTAASWQSADIAMAEDAMAAWDQKPLFSLRATDAALDAVLAARGYQVVEPVTLMAAPVERVADAGPDRMTTFAHWPRMAITEDLWQQTGLGPPRLAVMDRASGPKVALLGRLGDRAAGVGFAAMAGEVVMVHALEVLPDWQRQGLARNLMRAAAQWGMTQGARTLALAVTDANLPARALYASLGLDAVGQYHYRAK
jgi:GNAT superfamily N-acetyltransferase